jgi:hypothetical protein
VAALALATSPRPRKLRVGLFADSPLQPRWVVEAFAKVAASEFAEVVVIASSDALPAAAPWPWRLYETLDRGLFGSGADPGERLHLERYIAHQRAGKIAANADSFLELDLDVAFALGDLDDRLLDGLARYGVWRFYADGSREVVEGAPLTGSGLKVRLAPGVAPRLVYQSWARTDPLSIARNRDPLLAKTSEFASRALREAQRSGLAWLEQCQALRETKPGTAHDFARFFPSLARRMVARGLEKTLHREQWFLAYRYGNGAIAADLEGFTRLMPPPGRSWAHPFPIENAGRHFVFFEQSGRICVIEIGAGGGSSAPLVVLERDYRLSHPFLLEHEGRLYMIPQTAESRRVELYRCVEFPLRWQLEKVLLEGVRCVDATVHRGAERWWMFASGEFDEELHIYHAARLDGEWRPHLRNPVKSDARCTRPAGRLYWRAGALYRPAQICVPGEGAGVSLNRVLRLTPQDYAERQVQRILGIRSVNHAAGLTVVDALTRRRRFA